MQCISHFVFLPYLTWWRWILIMYHKNIKTNFTSKWKSCVTSKLCCTFSIFVLIVKTRKILIPKQVFSPDVIKRVGRIGKNDPYPTRNETVEKTPTRNGKITLDLHIYKKFSELKLTISIYVQFWKIMFSPAVIR